MSIPWSKPQIIRVANRFVSREDRAVTKKSPPNCKRAGPSASQGGNIQATAIWAGELVSKPGQHRLPRSMTPWFWVRG